MYNFQRPLYINRRTQIGHWEADTMEGKAHKNGLNTNIERLSRKLFIFKINKIDSYETIKAQKSLFLKLPAHFRKSATFDNGKENIKHQSLHQFGIQTFFADPYSAWQKGSVENAISIVRRYLPKATDLTYITQLEINQIQEEINNRPRKVLNYSTPNEVFNSHLRCLDLT